SNWQSVPWTRKPGRSHHPSQTQLSSISRDTLHKSPSRRLQYLPKLPFPHDSTFFPPFHTQKPPFFRPSSGGSPVSFIQVHLFFPRTGPPDPTDFPPVHFHRGKG